MSTTPARGRFRPTIVLPLVAVAAAALAVLMLAAGGTHPEAAAAAANAQTPDPEQRDLAPGAVKPGTAAASPAAKPTADTIPFPQEFKGTWRPVLSAQYTAELEASYTKHRRPGMPKYKKWAKELGKMESASWSFRDGQLTATQGKETQQASFQVKALTADGVLLAVKHPTYGVVEFELARLGGEQIEVRFPQVTAPALRMQRVSG